MALVRLAVPNRADLDHDACMPPATPRIRFDRHELAGAFGDIGTDLPLLVALVATCGLDAASIFVMFGLLQIVTGLLYGLPMPVQPLKAMAAIMLAQKLSAGTFAGGGIVIGLAMLVLTFTGALEWLARVVPREVVRGIQLGLGITLATLALKQYVVSDGVPGYVIAAVSAALLLSMRGKKKIPAPLVVMGLGLVYAFATKSGLRDLHGVVGLRLPKLTVPTPHELSQGALLLALPQIPLSIGNSVLATSQTTQDLFPERPVPVRKIGLTYALMNLVAPWFGGAPACHGCGGLVGFYGFGARTGGAPVIYGSMYLIFGLFLAPGLGKVVGLFPMPVLGVVLAFEAVALMALVRDVASDKGKVWIAVAVAAMVVGFSYGYLIGLVVGTLMAYAMKRGVLAQPGAQ